MNRPLLIAPSILAANFAALGDEIAAAERGGADLIHVDIMDGHFVPNLTMGPPVVRSLKKVAKVELDVHLMIEEPDRFVEEFIKAGAAMISVHVEVLPHLHRTIQFIKSLGARAGVAINPSTPVIALDEIAPDLDHVLVMSVNPGFGGQTFIPRSESKIQAIRALLDRHGNAAPIEVDGGIDLTNAARIVAAGASILVAGQLDLRHRGPRAGHARAARRRLDGGDAAGMTAEQRSVSRVRVRYAETDKMGVVYHANYFIWFEIGRTDLLRSLGWSYREMEEDGVSLPVIEAQCRYHRSAKYDDELEVRAEGRMLSPVRMEFTYQVVRREDQAVAASGRTVHAALDRAGRPCRLPERIRRVFA